MSTASPESNVEAVQPNVSTSIEDSSAGKAMAAAVSNDLGDNWWDKMPDDIKAEPSLRKFKDLSSLAKSYVHAQKAIGMDKVVLPSKHATEADWKAFWTKVGLPEKLEDYKVDVPENKIKNAELMKNFTELAHKSGIMPKQAGEILNWYLGVEEKTMLDMEKAAEKQDSEWKATLQKEWGEAYDKKVNDANLALSHINDQELNKWLEETGAGSHPGLVRAFAKFSELLKEHKIVGDSANVSTPNELDEKINSVLTNLQHPYYIASHPGHKAAVKEMDDWMKRRYKDESIDGATYDVGVDTEELFNLV